MLMLLGGARFVARTVYERPLRGFRAKDARRVLIVGAGDGGRLVLREILRNPALGLNPVGFVDDDPTKRGIRIDGVRVLGGTDDSPGSSTRPSPTRSRSRSRRRPARCAAAWCAVPRARHPRAHAADGLRAAAGRRLNGVRQVRNVEVEDVLGREPVRDGGRSRRRVPRWRGRDGDGRGRLDRLRAVPADRSRRAAQARSSSTTPRTTSSASSASSRTIATFIPPARPVLADCKEGERMREVFAEHRPTVVFHAAAYKHVGLMELNPVEAVRNNALATRLMARIAGEHEVARFVLVSTDKAVRPATVMGASKALAEYAVEAAQQRWTGRGSRSCDSATCWASRLGRPDLPPADRQGRPGHRHRRAHDAVLHDDSGGCSARHPLRQLGQGGEIFVLEMGEPVSILQLAREDDRAQRIEARRGHRDRGRRAPAGRETTRGAVQPVRALAADTGGEDPARRAQPLSTRTRSRRCSTRSACWCSRATPLGLRRRSRDDGGARTRAVPRGARRPHRPNLPRS